MNDIDKQFAHIADALNLASGSPDFDHARGFHADLIIGIVSGEAPSAPLLSIEIEEALVWRILADRVLRELGSAALFPSRTKGAAAGTNAIHPAIDALAKTYERLRQLMKKLQPAEEERDGSATGLPMTMMKLLQETEGFLDDALGLKPGDPNPFRPRLPGREARAAGEPV